jgi:hypothetical protein
VLAQFVTPRVVQNNLPNVAIGEWGPTLKIVERYYSSNGVPIDEDKDWINNSWYADRFKVRPTASNAANGNEILFVKEGERTAYLHYNREPRFYASVGFDRGIYFGFGYIQADVKYCQCFNGEVSGPLPGSGSSITGYFAKKMHHFKNIQTATTYSREYYPFPVYRLADLYLMYAEAVNEVEGPNGPNSGKMFEYLDAVRERAGLAGVKESWANFSINPDKPNSQDGLREIIQRERTIELAFEGKRFWDIRRWNKIRELNEQPRGWNIMGENEKDFYQVVNVDSRMINFTTKDNFFPIRESNLYVNNHLIQNYGW